MRFPKLTELDAREYACARNDCSVSYQSFGMKNFIDDVKNLFTSPKKSSFTSHKAFTLAEGATHVETSAKKCTHAFTLAEVLITLGIIGIVASMTLPALTAKHRKVVIETSLKKFYTTMNQAILHSSVVNGPTQYWEFPNEDTIENNEAFYNRYFKGYVNALETRKFHSDEYSKTFFTIYLTDGSGVMIGYKGKDWRYCLNAKYLNEFQKRRGSKCFMFGFYPSSSWTQEHLTSNYGNKGLEPYVASKKTDENGNQIPTTMDDLYSQRWFAKAIQLNNWTIPDDYPVKY